MSGASFKTIDRGKARIQKQLELAAKHVALVGVPHNAEQPLKDDGTPAGINMASLAFIMEKGSEVNKIPARPFMQRTRQRAKGAFQKLLRKYYQAIFNGKLGALKALKNLGEAYEGAMKETFVVETFAPNSPITIHGGWMRNKVSGKVFKVEPKKSSRPLINNGRLRQSIIHKVAKI